MRGLRSTVCMAAVCLMAATSLGDVLDFTSFDGDTAVEGSTANPYTFTVDAGGTSVDVILEATEGEFVNWDVRGDGLGFEDSTGDYTSWVDSKSGDTETVVMTFAVAGNPTAVNLGTGGLSIYTKDNQLTIDGIDLGTTSGLYAGQEVSSITISALASGNNRGTLVSVDVASVVPEPATMSLLGLGGLGILARRRRR